MMTTYRKWILSAVVCVLLGGLWIGPARAQQSDDSGAVELGSRYADPLHGFSLQAPTGTERQRQAGSAQLVRWQKRDDATGAILWTLSVLEAVEASSPADMAEFADALARTLRREQGLEADAVEVLSLPGRQAISISGQREAVGTSFVRQVWIPAEGDASGRFIVLAISGPVTEADRLMQVSDAVLATVNLFDPATARATREERLQAGAELLDALAGEESDRLDAAFDGKTQWFLFRKGGEPIGWMRTKAAQATHSDVDGYAYRSWVMLDVPEARQVVYKTRTLFTSADRNFETWQERLMSGGQEVREEGMKQHELIVCKVHADGQTQTLEKQAPMAIYLPRAMAAVLPRLVDLTGMDDYGFATYTTQGNSFDLRTFKVEGPHRVSVDGREVPAIRCTDRVAEDAGAAKVWVDDAGRLVRLDSPEDVVLAPASEGQVRAAFADVDQVLRRLEQ